MKGPYAARFRGRRGHSGVGTRSDVYWAYNSGVMNGVSGNRFAPNNSYTHEQSIATMLRLYDTKYAEVPSKTAAKYTVVVDSDDGFNVQMHLEDAKG